jgi:hypothetical protein
MSPRRFTNRFTAPCPRCPDGVVTVVVSGHVGQSYGPPEGCYEGDEEWMVSECSRCHAADWTETENACIMEAVEPWDEAEDIDDDRPL